MFDSGVITEKTLKKNQEEFKNIAESTLSKDGSLKLVNHANIRDIYRAIATLLAEALENIEASREKPKEITRAAKIEVEKLTLKESYHLILDQVKTLEKYSKELSKEDEKLGKRSPFSVLIDALRDNMQSNKAGMVSLIEFLPILPLYNKVGFYQVEAGGGRYGLEKPVDQGYFPSDYLRMIKEKLPNTETVELQRASVGSAFTRQTRETLKKLNKEVYIKSGSKAIRTFTSSGHIDDMRPAIKAMQDASEETGMLLQRQAEIAIGISKNKQLYTEKFYVDLAQRYYDAGATKIGAKDYSGVQEGWNEESDAISVYSLIKALKKAMPQVEIVHHNHNTAQRGIDSSVAAILAGAAGATVNTYSSNDYGQPPAERVARKLVSMDPENFRSPNAAELALVQVIQLFHESFIDARNAKYEAKPVNDNIIQGVKDTTAAGGGLAGVRADLAGEIIFLKEGNGFQKDEYGDPKVTRARDRMLLEQWGDEMPVAQDEFKAMSEHQKNEMAVSRLEKIYMKYLDFYKEQLGDPSLVTPMYEYISRLTVANLKNVALTTSKTENDLQDLNRIVLTPDIKDMIRGNVDAPPGGINKILVDRVIKEDIEKVIQQEVNKGLFEKGLLPLSDLATEKVMNSLREFGNNINKRTLAAKAVKDATDWINDIDDRLEKCPLSERDYFLKRSELAAKAYYEAVAKLDKDGVSYNDYVAIKTGNAPEAIINQLSKADGLGSIDAKQLSKLLAVAMPNIANPSDLLQDRSRVTEQVINILLNKEKIYIPEGKIKEVEVMIASDPNVGIDDNGEITEKQNGPSKLKPITFLRTYSKAHKFLTEKCDYMIKSSPRTEIDREGLVERVTNDKHLVAFVVTSMKSGISEATIHNDIIGTMQKYTNWYTNKESGVAVAPRQFSNQVGL